jgi:hypothetical protein
MVKYRRFKTLRGIDPANFLNDDFDGKNGVKEMSLKNKISISGSDKTTKLFCTDQEGFIGW